MTASRSRLLFQMLFAAIALVNGKADGGKGYGRTTGDKVLLNRRMNRQRSFWHERLS